MIPRTSSPALALAAALVAAAFLDASSTAQQQLLRVGATRTYADIGAAVTAANAGDVILVDPGTYPPFDLIGKGLSILADSTPYMLAASSTRSVINVTGIPSGQSATISGFQSSVSFGAAPALEIHNCTGHVAIREASLTPTADLTLVPMRAVVEIDNASSVWFLDFDVWPSTPRNGRTTNSVPVGAGQDDGIAAMLAEHSVVLVQRTRLRGYDNFGSGAADRWGGDALRLLGSTMARLHGNGTQLRGGDSPAAGGSAVQELAVNPLQDVLRCGGVTLTAGQGPAPGGIFAVNHDRGHFGIFQRTVAFCLPDTFGQVGTDGEVRLGTTHMFTVASTKARAYVLFWGIPKVTPHMPGYQNTALLSPVTGAVRTGALAAPSYSDTFGIAIPNTVSILGLQFAAQAVLGAPAGQSTPALSFTLGEMLVFY